MRRNEHDFYYHQKRLAVLTALGDIKPISEDYAKLLISQYKVYCEDGAFSATVAGNISQMKALDRLAHGDSKLINVLVFKFGEMFRNTIEEYKVEFGRVPNDDELIWIAGVHAGKDPREIVAEIEREIKELGGDDSAYNKLYMKYKGKYGEAA